MSNTAIKVEDLSKQYRLGEVGTGTISHDLNRWWCRIRGKEDPYLKVGETNDRSKKGASEYVWALKDINFKVNQGEVLGIIGKNGAGKSTLLKLLSKVTAPTTGLIKAKGRIASLLEVGTGFHPEMTGRENIFMNGTIMGMTRPEITKKLDEIVDFAGIERYLDTPAKRYSSGMTVRLGFAIAAHLEPEILIVDEVLAVGDAEFQKKALGKMQDVSKGEGRTVLFVSHNMASVQSLCDTGIVMENGTLAFQGSCEDAVGYYLSSGVALSNTDLTTRTDRKGKGKIRFTSVQLLNVSDQPIDKATVGMDVQFKINFKKNEDVNNVIFRLQIVDKNGYIVATLNNYHSSSPFNSLSSNSVFCKIPRLPIIDGQYTINLQCLVNKIVMDELESAYSFSVEMGDYYQTGKIPGVKQGVLLQHSWYQ